MKNIIALLLFSFPALASFAQKEKLAKVVAGFPVNYEEDSVGTYVLPDPLTLNNGQRVTNAKTWMEKRRPEIVKLFEEEQFGKAPQRPSDMHFDVFDKGTETFNGKAIRKQVRVYFTKDTTHKMDLLIYLPKQTKPSPLLLIINFSANNSVVDDASVRQGFIWTKEGKKIPAPKTSFGKINVDTFVTQGIGVATVYYGDIEPDFKEGFKYGIRGAYLKPAQSYPADDEWGAISAWSWGLSRAMDYFETDKDIDAKRIALHGVSRLGKTVLWTGAKDPRFKLVIASCSGEGGAALSRRNYGESINHMTDTSRYFYQFAPNRHNYASDPNKSPVDAHMLVALMAPRPLLLQTGDTDYWSDPKGEFLAAVAAEPVYNLFGKKGPGTTVMPQPGDQSLLNTLGYYMHAGGHGTVPSDWAVYMTFLKKYL
ncbi:alpha/beta hydrolase family protein [Flavisolibacter ginsenosidimutans]|uniref:Acetylxylan esterase n=1 Tax=Flavisolibacter ginsenosidimutans TaxID=661481 RepID=A0A5B8UKQ3_9BACT|nr:acetylxylan esterase [Flavisolibacter ginsenosidimutans]QEC56759.1 acetylxylan esterase [Flavisolibacter ginsenosidimutans]